MSASDEDDDFYGTVSQPDQAPSVPKPASNPTSGRLGGKTPPAATGSDGDGNGRQPPDDAAAPSRTEPGDEDADDDDDEDSEDYDGDDYNEDDSTDSDIEIILERPQNQLVATSFPADIKLPTRVPVTISAPPSAALPPTSQNTQQKQQQPQLPAAQSPALTNASTSKVEMRTKIIPAKFGANLPEVRTSSVDVSRVPEWEAVGKPITEIDIDADLADQAKPWRMPGADQSDYFNYGFDEFTWTTYCLRQQSMAAVLHDQKTEAAKFEMMMGGGPGAPNAGPVAPVGGGGHMMGPSGPGVHHPQAGPGGMIMGPGGGGPVPGGMDEQMMHQMMSQMIGQGVDPNELGFDGFMQQMQQMQGQNPMGGPSGPGSIMGPPQGPSGGQWGGGGGGGGNQKMRRW